MKWDLIKQKENEFMGNCNLEMTDECYGCGYYGSGDIEGCKLTIAFHKKHPNHTDEEYEQYMLNCRKKNSYERT